MMCHEKSFFNTSPQSLFLCLVLVLPVGSDALCALGDRFDRHLVLLLLLLQRLLQRLMLLLLLLLQLLLKHLLLLKLMQLHVSTVLQFLFLQQRLCLVESGAGFFLGHDSLGLFPSPLRRTVSVSPPCGAGLLRHPCRWRWRHRRQAGCCCFCCCCTFCTRS